MILINKNPSNEPNSWKEYKHTPGVDYTPNKDLRDALLAEQGYICAFCMRSVPLSKKDPSERETSKIAHLLSRTNHPDKKLDYENLVICCAGNINGEAHCDKSQGASDITLPLFNIQLQNSIIYRSYTGEINSSNEDWNEQINKVLNLNHAILKLNRLEALNGVRQVLEKKKWTKAQIQDKLEAWANLDRDNKLKPYCGIVIWYLQKKLKQI